MTFIIVFQTSQQSFFFDLFFYLLEQLFLKNGILGLKTELLLSFLFFCLLTYKLQYRSSRFGLNIVAQISPFHFDYLYP